MMSRSTTTEVSSRPAAGRSATRIYALIHRVVQVLTKPSTVHPGSFTEEFSDQASVHEPTAPQRPQLTDRHGVARHDEGSTFPEGAHDPAAVVAQFPLTDHLTHPPTVAPRATVPRCGNSPRLEVEQEGQRFAKLTEDDRADVASPRIDSSHRHRPHMLTLSRRQLTESVGRVGFDHNLGPAVPDRPRQGNDLDDIGTTPKDSGSRHHHGRTLQTSLTAGRRPQVELDDITRRQHRAMLSRLRPAGSQDPGRSRPDGAHAGRGQPFRRSSRGVPPPIASPWRASRGSPGSWSCRPWFKSTIL